MALNLENFVVVRGMLNLLLQLLILLHYNLPQIILLSEVDLIWSTSQVAITIQHMCKFLSEF